MRRFIVLNIGLFAVLIQVGCSEVVRTEGTRIGELDKKPVVFEPVEEVRATNRDAREHYRQYLADNENSLYYGEALKRLAALELEESETRHGQVTEQQTDAGERSLKSAIEHYSTYLRLYPNQQDNDLVLYQLAKAYSFTGDSEKTLETFDQIVARYPNTQYIDEVNFRRGEILFNFRDYPEAEKAYSQVVARATADQYLERAQYKLAWTQFKQSKYVESIESCIDLLDRKQAQGKIGDIKISRELVKTERIFVSDVLRIMSISLSYREGTKTIREVLAAKGPRQYEPLIYQQLGELYMNTERTIDAVNVFLDYAKLYPDTLFAAEFHIKAIEAYSTGDFAEQLLATKKEFVKRFGVGTAFWSRHDVVSKQHIQAELKKSIRDLANYYHAIAQKTKLSKDYVATAAWYKEYIRSFPQDKDAPLMNFLLAEAQYDAGYYRVALDEYIKTAYNYNRHDRSDEAGYAAVLTYRILIGKAEKQGDLRNVATLQNEALENAIRFSYQFKDSKHAPAVIAKTAEQLYEKNDYVRARDFSRNNAHLQNLEDKSHFRTTWLVYAHANFELKDFLTAEQAYSTSLALISKKEKLHKDVSERLAASIYMQGLEQRDNNRYELASYHFLRVGQIVPASSIVPTAQYDAATMQIQLANWDSAVEILEDFRNKYPNDRKFSQGVTEKLVLSYSKSGRLGKAADEIYQLSLVSTDVTERRDLTWQAAETYQQAGNKQKANNIYIAYIEKYPRPFVQSMEAHQRVMDYYSENKATRSLRKWQEATVKAEKLGNTERTDRTRLIAANAALELAEPGREAFRRARLTIPLKKSLQAKKGLMEKVLKSYADLMEYGIAEITTASTYHVADVYGHFATALLESQRPSNLNAEELEQYDILLEEQAYPFEEKSIEMHSTNAMRTSEGIYDNWVRKSMKALSELQPIRYAKTERIETHVAKNYYN